MDDGNDDDADAAPRQTDHPTVPSPQHDRYESPPNDATTTNFRNGVAGHDDDDDDDDAGHDDDENDDEGYGDDTTLGQADRSTASGFYCQGPQPQHK